MIFMLSVLGSVIFWSIYIPLSFFIAAALCKNKDKNDKSYLINVLVRKKYYGDNYNITREANGEDKFFAIIGFLLLICAWPLWIAWYLISNATVYIFKFLEWIIALGLEKTPIIEVKLEKENDDD